MIENVSPTKKENEGYEMTYEVHERTTSTGMKFNEDKNEYMTNKSTVGELSTSTTRKWTETNTIQATTYLENELVQQPKINSQQSDKPVSNILEDRGNENEMHHFNLETTCGTEKEVPSSSSGTSMLSPKLVTTSHKTSLASIETTKRTNETIISNMSKTTTELPIRTTKMKETIKTTQMLEAGTKTETFGSGGPFREEQIGKLENLPIEEENLNLHFTNYETSVCDVNAPGENLTSKFTQVKTETSASSSTLTESSQALIQKQMKATLL